MHLFCQHSYGRATLIKIVNQAKYTARTPVIITLSVWKALFLREAVSRLSAGRAAWFWLLLEPLMHIVFLAVLFTVIRMRTVGGIDTALWIMVGMLAFFMFRQTGTQSMNAVNANQALFAYRQVKPVDAVLVRAGMEGFLLIMIATTLFFGAGLFGMDVIPADPLAVLRAFFGLWLIGLGFGLVTSVIREMTPELGKFIGLAMMPLYFFSGVIIPISSIPEPYRSWLLFNPVAHGLEAARLGFAPHYHAVADLSVSCLYGFALVAIFIGLALHIRFSMRMIAL